MELLTDYTLRTVVLGAVTLGIVSGALGTFAVLRQQSLLGDAISHAALPGIALAFLLTGSKLPLVLMLGAAAAGWLATLLVMAVTRTTRVKYDSALGLMLSVFFGFGLVLLTFIQRRPDANQAGLDTFLFGQAAALVTRDVLTMGVLGTVALVLMLLFWKEFKLLAFDPAFGHTLGLRMGPLDVLLTSLLVVAIVIGLQAVGVVLMSAMLIAPAASARQWTDRLGLMVALSALFGALAGTGGALLSSTAANLPTGPMIVLCAGVLVVVSLLFAPNRGLLARQLRARRNSRRLRHEAVLLDLYALSSQHTDPGHPHHESVLDVMRDEPVHTRRSLEALAGQGYVRPTGDQHWALTPEGTEQARRLLAARGETTDRNAGNPPQDANA
ncbi:metal ABC transporter permease [Rhodocaloribacter litoris]|uniref:metal ABC transporter permease n=1 Tax=Rhodocaloribacter litoris TaxID=2558931 RepID=UPI00141E1908|nr:metal ABC transporter permease [Rhodocaloribacter litoris]QXD14444.1 metal ABC transporter permease [Rhodocaloribacter litoris]